MSQAAGKERAAEAAACLHLVSEAHKGTAGADERLRAHLRAELALRLLRRLGSDPPATLSQAGAVVQAYWEQLQGDATASAEGGRGKPKAKRRRKSDKSHPAGDADAPADATAANAHLYLPYVERAGAAMRSVVDDLADHAGAAGTQPPAPAFALAQCLRALGHLEALDPKLAHLARLRWFGGLEVDVAARALQDNEADTRQRWQRLRAYVAVATTAMPPGGGRRRARAKSEGATTPRKLPDAAAWPRLATLFDAGSAMPRAQHETWLPSLREQVRPSTLEWLREMLAAASAADADDALERGPHLPRVGADGPAEGPPAFAAGGAAASAAAGSAPATRDGAATGDGAAAAALPLPTPAEAAASLPGRLGAPLLGTGMQLGPWLLVGPMPASDPRITQWRVRRAVAAADSSGPVDLHNSTDAGTGNADAPAGEPPVSQERAPELALLVPLAWRPRPGIERWLPHLAERAAALHHPNIARIVEAGVTAEGTPWIATELAEGQTIERWCRDHGLRLRERRTLMEHALAAVQYAHARRVLHAQVHPSQIVVAPDGRVRWLNFGLAELLAWLDVPAVPASGAAGPPPIEAYAAPELQARPADTADEPAEARPRAPAFTATAATTASDAYALGLVLFEVLSGASPWQPQTPGSKHRNAEGTSWRRPSDLAASLQLRLALRGDYDAIVAKATQTDPARRYVGAASLLEDLRRAGRHARVDAAQGGLGYDVRRLFKRHPAIGSLALGTFVAFVAATVVMSWSALSLLHERDDAIAAWGSAEASARLLRSLLDDGELPAGAGASGRSSNGAARPWLAHAETVARSALKEQPAQLAGMLALLAQHHLERGALAKGRALLAEAAPQLQQSSARQEAGCNEAWAQARQGDHAQEAEQRLRRASENASMQPLARALCLARLADLEWRSGRERDAYHTGSLARSMWSRSPERPPQMALLLARPMIALGLTQGRVQDTHAWTEWVLQQLALLGRQDSTAAIELREQWSALQLAAGDARQAQALADAALAALTGSSEAAGTDVASAPPVSLLLAAAEPRLELHQLADARARLERALTLAEMRGDATGARRARCLAAVAALRAQDTPAAERLFKAAMTEVRSAGVYAAAAAAADGPAAHEALAASANSAASAPAGSIGATLADETRPRARAAAHATDQACRAAGLELALAQARYAEVQREAEQLNALGDAHAPQLRAVTLLLRAEAMMAAKAYDRAVGAALSALQQARALQLPPPGGSQGARPSFRSGQAGLVLAEAHRANGDLKEAAATLEDALQQLAATLPEVHPWRRRAEATRAALAAQAAQAVRGAKAAAAQRTKSP